MPARWVPVVGWEKVYAVSSLGQIKRVQGGDRNTIAGRILRTHNNGRGYLSVMLCRHGRTRRIYVHKVVARAFLGRRPRRMTVNHRDGDKANNRPRNLEYVTLSANLLHKCRVLKKGSGDDHYRAQLSNTAVQQIRRLLHVTSRRAIAVHFNVAYETIGAIARGHTYKSA
jgi:hypothetical protein